MEEASGAGAAGDRPGGEVGGDALEWCYRPWRERPGRAATACAALALAGALLAAAGLPLLVAVALFVALGLALEPAYLASRYRVDAEGLERATRVGAARLSWRAARVWRRRRLGVEVSAGGREWWPRPGGRLRLDLPDGERASLLAALEERRREHEC